VRGAVTALAEQHTMPAENLIQPDAVRRLAWQPPADPTIATVSKALAAAGARSWQIALVAGPIAAALPDPPEPEPTAEVPELEDADDA
jgi:ribonuclease D